MIFDNLSLGKGWTVCCPPSNSPFATPIEILHEVAEDIILRIFFFIFRILESQRLCDNNLCRLRHTLQPLAPPPKPQVYSLLANDTAPHIHINIWKRANNLGLSILILNIMWYIEKINGFLNKRFANSNHSGKIKICMYQMSYLRSTSKAILDTAIVKQRYD